MQGPITPIDGKSKTEAKFAATETSEFVSYSAPSIPVIAEKVDRNESERSSPRKPQGMKLGGVKLPLDKPVGKTSEKTIAALGFKTPSDSEFWDAIDDDAPELTPGMSAPNVNDGWDDGWGNDGALDDLDEQPNKPPPGHSIQISTPSSPTNFLRTTDLISGEDVNFVEERAADSQRRKEERMGAKKLSSRSGDVEGADNWDW
jgi:hypothetical protein